MGVLGVIATLQEGRAAEKQGQFAKQIALRNQRALERQAVAEQEAAAIKSEQIARQEKIVSGSQIAAASKSGGQIAGSSLSFLADTARQFSLSRNFALRAGLFRSQELKEKGGIIAAQGRFANALGKFQKRQSFLRAGAQVGELIASGRTTTKQPQTLQNSPTRFGSQNNIASGGVAGGGGTFTRNFSASSFR